MTTVQINLSDQLAQEAQSAGLLTETAIERLLRAERIEHLAQAREHLAVQPLPLMTSEEIQAEVDAYRAEQRRAAGA